ncbi:MAG: hypothetical protein KAS29_11445, partial [Bacteroidales bacterium]|nr:hypothetical protein [Bacteroidales bacterium]
MILLRIFKNNRATGTAGIILLLLAIFVPSFIDAFGASGPEELLPYSGMPFYNLIFGAIHKVPVLNHLVTMLTMMLIAYTLIRIGVRDQLLQQRSLMPAVFFILFAAALPEARQVSPALIGSLFYLLCFAILFEVQDKKPDTLSIFVASLILVLGSMFYLKLIWFVPLIWISLWTMRSVTWRELFYPVVAYVLLALLLFTWFWGIHANGAGFVELVQKNMVISGAFEPNHLSVFILYGFMLLLVLIASIYMANRFRTMKTVAQKIYQVMFYMFLAALLFYHFIARIDPANLVFIAIPLTFVLSNYFHRKKSPWIHEIIIWILLGLVVYVQLMV